MTVPEWTSLIVARKAIEQYRGSTSTPEIDEVTKKLSANFNDVLSSGSFGFASISL